MFDLTIQIKNSLLILIFLFASGCSLLTSSVTHDFGENLKQVMLNHNDPETVLKAIPSYLLLQETLLIKDPENEALLMSTAYLYSAYNTLLGSQGSKRKQGLSKKAFDLALHGACIHKDDFCKLNGTNFDDFTQIIDRSGLDDLDTLYGLGVTWASWIQDSRSDWNAVAQLAQVKHLMNHVINVKEDYKKGEAFLYLAIMESIVPPALGGKPDVAKHSFEKALQFSSSKNLMVHVLYAQHYAKMMFDRVLHDSLLNTVMTTQIDQKGFTLSNTLAQQQAKKLLQNADDYF